AARPHGNRCLTDPGTDRSRATTIIRLTGDRRNTLVDYYRSDPDPQVRLHAHILLLHAGHHRPLEAPLRGPARGRGRGRGRRAAPGARASGSAAVRAGTGGRVSRGGAYAGGGSTGGLIEG